MFCARQGLKLVCVGSSGLQAFNIGALDEILWHPMCVYVGPTRAALCCAVLPQAPSPSACTCATSLSRWHPWPRLAGWVMW